MRQAFHVPEEAAFLNPSLLRWKYYDTGPSWPGSRSYVLSDKGTFLAHAAILPLKIRFQSGVRQGIGFYDWAASDEHRGIGLVLLKKIMALAPFVLVIGGAEITRQVLSRVGFKAWAGLPVYARVNRPFRQFTTRPSRSWKEPIRLARNTLWSRARLASVGDWTADLSLPDGQTLSLVHGQTGTIHDRDFLAFMLRCPAVPIRCFVLRKAGVPRGYAVLSIVRGQGRIADLRIASTDQVDWDAAIALLVKTFAHDTAIAEVSAIGSVPLLQSALQSNGFRLRERRPLVVLDPEGEITREAVPQLGMLVDDAGFLDVPEFPYLT